VISILENSNTFPKNQVLFWKEKLVEDVVTLGPMAQATLVNIISQIFPNPDVVPLLEHPHQCLLLLSM
jgi:hypothetical protein